MSIFSNQAWPGACMSANQSPINLSQSSAKPCDLSCSFSFDDMTPPSGEVTISDEGILLLGAKGSCKFREQTYTCDFISVNHPSHHTLEGVQADGEVVVYCRSPTGDMLMVSALFRVNPNDTPSSSFFKQFVPYAQTTGSTQVSLNGWSLKNIESGAYYVYSGSSLVPPCVPSECVVFKTMINMDPTDFSFLVRNVQAGSRNIQSLGNRDVFYNENSGNNFALPHDNKTYLVMRPLKGNNMKKPKAPRTVDLKTEEAKQLANSNEDKKSTTAAIKKHVSENPWEIIGMIVSLLLTIGGVYYAYHHYLGKDGKPVFSFYEWIRDTIKRWRLGPSREPLVVPVPASVPTSV
jgi:carbonic anhydrase